MKKISNLALMRILAYLYLISGYSYIIYHLSYYVRVANKPLGWLLLIGNTIMYTFIYTILNHILIKKIVSKRTLIIIEIILILTMLVLLWSDIKFENRTYATLSSTLGTDCIFSFCE